MKKSVRIEIGKKRLVSVLRAQTVSCDRTLEQKISDAGPNPMRIEPTILTQARDALENSGVVKSEKRGKAYWYYLAEAGKEEVESRLAELAPLHDRTQEGAFTHRLGQTLEIAVLRAIQRSGVAYLGHFADLGDHDDSTAYTKVDPTVFVNGNKIEKGPLDYITFPAGIAAGIEVKKYRTWLYPRSSEVRELLWKCADADAVPVLITRRLPFLTIRLLQASGCITHENYNQLYPGADAALAEEVRKKDKLGYHDVRTGNEPDGRLLRFVAELLPVLVQEARPAFERFREAHRTYGKGESSYLQWYRQISRLRKN